MAQIMVTDKIRKRYGRDVIWAKTWVTQKKIRKAFGPDHDKLGEDSERFGPTVDTIFFGVN